MEVRKLELPIIGEKDKLNLFYAYVKHLSPFFNINYSNKEFTVLASIMNYIHTHKGDFKSKVEFEKHLCQTAAREEIRKAVEGLYVSQKDKIKNSLEKDYFNNIVSSLRKKNCFTKFELSIHGTGPTKTLMLANMSIFNIIYSEFDELNVVFRFRDMHNEVVKE